MRMGHVVGSLVWKIDLGERVGLEIRAVTIV